MKAGLSEYGDAVRSGPPVASRGASRRSSLELSFQGCNKSSLSYQRLLFRVLNFCVCAVYFQRNSHVMGAGGSIEGGGEGAVEFIDVAFIFHHRGAGEIVKGFDIVGRETCFHSLKEGKVFAQADRDGGAAQVFEEGLEHGIRG